MKIGIIGAGHIGGTLAKLFLQPVTRSPSATHASRRRWPVSSRDWATERAR
jgi:predicted dinucleotide-binding enzyme